MEYLILIYADESRYATMPEGQMARLMADFASYTQALAWAGRCPVATMGTIEVRPVTA